MTKPKKGLSLVAKQGLTGIGFISPWLIGIVFFFLVPLASTVRYMFGDVKVGSGGIIYKYIGLENIKEVFFRNPDNGRMILENLGSSIGSTLLVLVFSIFAALLINQKFHGRALVRALFALPIIVSSGVLLQVFKQDLFAQTMSGEAGSIFQSSALETMMFNMGLSQKIITFVTGFVDSIMDIIWKAGVQILLFLAGLQAIPTSLYEVSSVEGATAWQTFWKITFPLLTPYLILNTIYTIIDAFTFYDNPVMAEVIELFRDMKYGWASVLSIVYSLVVFLLIGIVFLVLSRFTYYTEK